MAAVPPPIARSATLIGVRDMTFGWRPAALTVLAGLVIIAGARLYLGPVHTLEPMGRCLKGDINLDDPVPFVQARFGGTILGLATSGGGSRSAYLTAAILREIRREGPNLRLGPAANPQHGLLDQIDAVSSVSGSSLAS